MSINNSNWWLPSKLAEKERAFRQINNIDELDTDNDFGCYRKILLEKKLHGSKLNFHNDINPKAKIYFISKLLKLNPKSILDSGCGLGITTRELAARYPNANVLGVDISKDAIEFAVDQKSNAEFKVAILDPNGQPLGEFDLIFCFEFYPFTRNRDVKIQSSYLQYFCKQLAPKGKIIIHQNWDNPESLASILQEVKMQCQNLSFDLVEAPHSKIYLWVPNSFISKIISKLLGKFLQKNLIREWLIVSKIN